MTLNILLFALPGTADDVLWPLLQRKLDVLNQAGLSKDNFHNSDAKNAKVVRSPSPKSSDPENSSSSANGSKITDFFSSSFSAQDLDDWGQDDSFDDIMDVPDSVLIQAYDEECSPAKRQKSS